MYKYKISIGGMTRGHDEFHIEVRGRRYRSGTDTDPGADAFIYLIQKAGSDCSGTFPPLGVRAPA
jgi:hypothetical protein